MSLARDQDLWAENERGAFVQRIIEEPEILEHYQFNEDRMPHDTRKENKKR